MARVPETGASLLANIPRLEAVTQMVRYQSKNFDGSGSPADAVNDEAIPLGARVLHVLRDLLAFESADLPRPKAFVKMQSQEGRYDPILPRAIAASLDTPLTAETTGPRRSIPLKELCAGSVLAVDVRTTNGLLIVTAGTTIPPVLLEKLRNFSKLYGLEEPILAVTPP